MKTLEVVRFVDIKAYKFTIFEILRDYHLLRVYTIPSCTVYRLSNYGKNYVDDINHKYNVTIATSSTINMAQTWVILKDI